MLVPQGDDIVHRKTYKLFGKPLKMELGEVLFENDPAPPETIDQFPVPLDGLFAFKAINVAPQVAALIWSTPALAIEGALFTTMVTSEKEETQVPFEIVHRSTVLPKFKPLIVLEGEVELEKVPLPEIIDHAPIPTVGVFAANVADVIQLF